MSPHHAPQEAEEEETECCMPKIHARIEATKCKNFVAVMQECVDRVGGGGGG